jgi:hypothetical protein
MNIYEKISAIMQAVQYVSKDDHVKFNATNYMALSEEKITQIMREQMIKHKLVVFPISMASSRAGQITHVDVVYRMVNAENPEEYIEIVSCGDGADSQDKGPGKAMTYAFKYMWLRTFALPTGEDPDKISSAELDAKQKAEAEAKAKAEAEARAKAEAEAKAKAEAQAKANPKSAKQVTPREQLIAKLAEKGIDVNVYAKEKGLSNKTTPERFTELLKELEG